ncbi:MAG: prolyl oligopeptidase family serine peptidase [Saprospiraceae bacterium]|nr:prolyl oligopeptidase family serine peptidase [Saprospiraceae bacterium]
MLFKQLVIIGYVGMYSTMVWSQSDFNVYDYWSKYPDPSNTLYEQLVERSTIQLNARREGLEEKMTAVKWPVYQKEIRKKLEALIGPFPSKTDLNPVIVSTIIKEDFTVEKMYFQSQPGFYVTAALFIPKNISLPAPAILFCSGHAAEGFRSSTYQHMILNYVKKGFIVFAFDPVGQGERYQYFDHEAKTYLQPTREHSYPGNQIFITGISPANYFIWDGIRAIDYLMTRSEVDSTRIGVTGRSGGGTQTAYIMALDDRVAAAAPECYLTTYSKLLRSIGPQDAEQIIKHMLFSGLDLTDLVHVRAPKPTLMVTTTRDIFSIQGARDVYHEARRGYDLIGAPENLIMVEDDAGHASTKKNREATYAFFQKHLNNPGNPSDQLVDTFRVEELWVTKVGQVAPELSSQTLFTLNKSVSAELNTKRKGQEDTTINWGGLQNQIKRFLNYEGPSNKPEIIYSGATPHQDHIVEKYLLNKHSGSPIPIIWLKPGSPTGKTVLLLDALGKNEQAKDQSLAWQMVDAGHHVILADLSGIGELSGGYGQGDAIMEGVPVNVWYASILTNMPIPTLRAVEIELIRQFIIDEISESDDIHVITTSTLTSDLLHAECLGSAFKTTILIDPLISFESLVMTEKYKAKYVMSAVLGSYPLYDLPLLTHFAGDKLLVINPRNAAGDLVEESSASNTYSKYRDQLHTQVLIATENEIGEKALEWLRKP